MPVEDDAEEVPDLALEPVRRRPDAGHRSHPRVASRQPHLHPQTRAVRDRHEDVHELEARLARPEVDSGQLRQKREAQIRLLGQHPRQSRPFVSRRIECGVQIHARHDPKLSGGYTLLKSRKERGGLHLRELLLRNLPLELDDPVDERFGPRRATGHVHVDRNDLIDALHESIVVEDPAD